jgi:3-oxoacyl-[acyl-carrier-protein] synthase II
MSERRRVVITGMGLVTPMGDDVEQVWKRLLNGETSIAPTTLFDASTFPTTFSSEVRGFALHRYLPPDQAKEHETASRNSQFALAAASMAWKMAKLAKTNGIDASRVGTYLGGGEGPIDFDHFVAAAIAGWDPEAGMGRGDLDAAKWARTAAAQLDAVCELEQDPNMAAAHIACLLNAQGPTFNTLTACAASTQAIGEATRLIRRGDTDIMISGGTHSMLHPLGATGFNRLTALSNRNDDYLHASRPFDAKRDGFVLGEGAGVVILEDYEHAKARNADIFGEILGYGSTADAFRVTDIHEEGRGGIAAMRQAIKDAGLKPEDVDYISAHGTSTEENDKIESLAIKSVFEDCPRMPAVSSIKSMMGHLIAAAGAVELIAALLTIRDNTIPPTINYEHRDSNCPLDYVPNEARKTEVTYVLSNSFGFGGQNDTLAVSACKD